MLVTRLVELYDRVEDQLVPPGYRPREIGWLISLGPDGRFRGFIEAEGDEGALLSPAPYRRRSGRTPPPYLLVDTPAYVLGLGLDKMSDEKAAPRHENYRQLVARCAEETGHPALQAVNRFLTEGLQQARREAPDGMGASDLIGFIVEDTQVWMLPPVRAFWFEALQDRAAEKSDREGQCLLCSERKPVAKRHPVELRVGPDRAQLVTANENAFESYGLEASEVAPICYACALKYGRALGYLLDSDEHRLWTAGGTYVFWTRQETDFNPWAFLSSPTPDEVRRLLTAPWRGREPDDVDANEFYALCVTSNQSRLVVRSWMETTVGRVRRHLADYFEAQRMVGPDGDDSPHGVTALGGATVRELNDVAPQTIPALLEFALTGRPLPTWLLHRAVQRARADTDNRMTRPRAALMRLVFESQRLSSSKEVPIVSPELDVHNTDPAYLCGRLLAVLEEVQRAALPGIKATLVDKYFGTACSAPATVFGTLLRNAQSHLAKLRKNNEPAYHALQNRLMDVQEALSGFPRTLTLQDQALFSLGYYQQMAADRQQMREHAAAKNSSD